VKQNGGVFLKRNGLFLCPAKAGEIFGLARKRIRPIHETPFQFSKITVPSEQGVPTSGFFFTGESHVDPSFSAARGRHY